MLYSAAVFKKKKKKVILAVYTVTLIANDLKAFFVVF